MSKKKLVGVIWVVTVDKRVFTLRAKPVLAEEVFSNFIPPPSEDHSRKISSDSNKDAVEHLKVDSIGLAMSGISLYQRKELEKEWGYRLPPEHFCFGINSQIRRSCKISNSIAGIFLCQLRALGATTYDCLRPGDGRFSVYTKEAILAIGKKHPVFVLARSQNESLIYWI